MLRDNALLKCSIMITEVCFEDTFKDFKFRLCYYDKTFLITSCWNVLTGFLIAKGLERFVFGSILWRGGGLFVFLSFLFNLSKVFLLHDAYFFFWHELAEKLFAFEQFQQKFTNMDRARAKFLPRRRLVCKVLLKAIYVYFVGSRRFKRNILFCKMTKP